MCLAVWKVAWNGQVLQRNLRSTTKAFIGYVHVETVKKVLVFEFSRQILWLKINLGKWLFSGITMYDRFRTNTISIYVDCFKLFLTRRANEVILNSAFHAMISKRLTKIWKSFEHVTLFTARYVFDSKFSKNLKTMPSQCYWTVKLVCVFL